MVEKIKGKVLLAPVAGVTDRAFREIAAELGAACTFTEMVSVRGLHYGDKKTMTLLECGKNAKAPTGAQLFGNEPEFFAETAQQALSGGASFIDLNCGCPMPKIVKNGDGSALLRSPERICDIVKALTKTVSVPVTVKLRLGTDADHINILETARAAQEGGAAWITVHGRTAQQLYSGTADWEWIARTVQEVSVPVVGNGDITSAEDAADMLRQTGCHAVMVARGAFGNPWLLAEIKGLLEEGRVPPSPTWEERVEVIKRHFSLIVQYKGEHQGIPEARKHALWYVKGMRGATTVKNKIVKANTLKDMFSVLNELSAFRTER